MRAVTLRFSAIQATYGIMGGVYLPFFSASLASRGISVGTIGLSFAIATLLRILVSPVAGLIADARDDRRLVLSIFSLGSFAGFLLLALVDDSAAIVLSSVVAIVLWTSSAPILESATLKAAERSGTPYGAVRVWLSIAFVAGNVISGLAVSRFGFAIVAPWLAVSAGLQLCTILMLYESEAGNAGGSFGVRFHATFAEARELLGKPVFLLFLTAASLIQGSHIVYYTYAGLIWRNQGMSAAVIGLIWPLGIIAEILLFMFSAPVVRRIGPVTLILIGALACALRWTMMAFDPALPPLLVAQLLHGLTFAVPHLGAMYFILRATPPRLSATAQSLYSVAIGIMSSLSLLPAGYFYAAWGGRIFLLMSAMAILAAILTALLSARWTGGRLTEISASVSAA